MLRRLPLLACFTLLLPAPGWAGKRSKKAPEPTPITNPVEPPSGFTPVEVVSVIPGSGGGTVLLADADRELVIPIGVGATEALSIALRAERRRYERPLTHDLLDEVVHQLGGEVTQLRIDDLRSGVFVAQLTLAQGERSFRLDLRASDAIALALGQGLPIWMADPVLAETGLPWAEFMAPPDLDPEMPMPENLEPVEPTQEL